MPAAFFCVFPPKNDPGIDTGGPIAHCAAAVRHGIVGTVENRQTVFKSDGAMEE